MTVKYLQGDSPEYSYYSFSYKELQEIYHEIVGMSDKKFLKDLPRVLHFAVFVAWLKELPTDQVLCDEGIIHQLVHLLHIGKEPYVKSRLKEIRKLFKKTMKLV